MSFEKDFLRELDKLKNQLLNKGSARATSNKKKRADARKALNKFQELRTKAGLTSSYDDEEEDVHVGSTVGTLGERETLPITERTYRNEFERMRDIAYNQGLVNDDDLAPVATKKTESPKHGGGGRSFGDDDISPVRKIGQMVGATSGATTHASTYALANAILSGQEAFSEQEARYRLDQTGLVEDIIAGRATINEYGHLLTKESWDRLMQHAKANGAIAEDYVPRHMQVNDPDFELQEWEKEMADDPKYRKKSWAETLAHAMDTLESSAVAGLASFNKGLVSTADVLIGNPLEALGWENNPIHKAKAYYDKEYVKYDKERDEVLKQAGWDDGVGNFLSETIEGSVAALPDLMLAYMTAGASAGASGGKLATQAAYNTGNILTKAGITAERMLSNPQFSMSLARTIGPAYDDAKANGADDTTAGFYAVLTGFLNSGIEIGVTGQSGIQGLLDDGGKPLLKWVTSSLEEGGEEILQGVVSDLFAKVSFDEDREVLDTKKMLKEGAMGTAVGAVLGGGHAASSVVDSALDKANSKPVFTENEQKVIDKEVENLIAEEEKDGTKLTNREKKAIREQVEKYMEKGYISTDTIEEVLGGDGYKYYTDTSAKLESLQAEYDELYNTKGMEKSDAQIDRQAELKKQLDDLKANFNKYQAKMQLSDQVYDMVKGDRLVESYNELARKHQAYQADLSKYDEKQRVIIQKAIDSGILNNTNRTHEFVDMVAKISADKGVLFDFTNNAKLKESGFALNGKTVNGYVTEDGITLNIQAAKALNKVVGHEITHVLEGTKLYEEFQKVLFDYATKKGEYQTRYDTLAELYKNVKNADIKKELTADLVGDYLFTDPEFINHLSVNHRNVFQWVYDQIKYLCNVASAGSKELRQLEKVKKKFADSYRADSKAKTGTQFSISETTDGRFVAVVDNDILSNIDTTNWDKAKKAEAKKAAAEALKKFSGGIVVDGITRKVNKVSRREYTRSEYTEGLYIHSPDVFADKMRAADVADDIVVVATNWNRDGGLKHPRDDNFVDFDHGETIIMSGNAQYSAEVVVGITDTGEAVFYDVVDLKPTKFDIKKEESPTTATTQNAIGDIQGDSHADNVAQETPVVKGKFSISNEGEYAETNSKYLDAVKRHKTKATQQMVDEAAVRAGVETDADGKPIGLYHGTGDFGFTKIDTQYSDDGLTFWATTELEVAESYFSRYMDVPKHTVAREIGRAQDRKDVAKLDPSKHSESEIVAAASAIFPEYKGAIHTDEQKIKAAKNGINKAKKLGEKLIKSGVFTGENLNAIKSIVETADVKTSEQLREVVSVMNGKENGMRTELNAKYSEKVEALFDDFLDAVWDMRTYSADGWLDRYGTPFTVEQLAARYNKAVGNKGVYRMYYKADNPYVIDCKGVRWNKIAPPAEMAGEVDTDGVLTTRAIAKWAFEHGYDSVKFLNAVDTGSWEASKSPATVWAFMNPQEQLWSADPVTYDDHGNVIPVGDRFSTKGDIRFSVSEDGSTANDQYSLQDSDGNQLTKEQNEYFKDSKVRDDNGNLMVMYHGSPESFTEFDRKKAKSSGYYGSGFYFTDSESHAGQYGNKYEVYLNITNPLQDGTNDITKEQLRKFVEAVAENEDYGIDNYGYGATIDSVTDSVYGKSDFAMLMDINASCVGNMVEAIELFNEVNGTDYNGIIAPTETIAFYPNQIKSVANDKPTTDPDIRFSLSESVEETNDLMALHNLHTSEVLKQLEMGGMPYPSVAITNPAKIAHDDFGEVTIILSKDAIDPKKSKYNHIYSSDAYTPTFPHVSYDANREVADNVISRVVAQFDKLPDYYQRSLRSLRDYTNLNDVLNRYGGFDGLVENYADDHGMKQLYLAEKGEAVPMVITRTETELSEYKKEQYQKVVDRIGADAIASLNDRGNYNTLGEARIAWTKEHLEILKDVYAEDWASDGKLSKEEALEIANEEKLFFWYKEAVGALEYLENGGLTIVEKEDLNATNAKVDEKIIGSDYKQWLNELFRGIEGQSGIRNSKDTFLPSGKRRSFAQLHDPVTIDNVIKAMRKKDQTGQGAFGTGNFGGASVQEYGSIAEAKRNSNMLGVIDETEYKDIKKSIDDRLFDISYRYANGKDLVDAKTAIVEAVAKNESKQGIARYLQQYDYVYKYTDDIGNDIIELRDYVRSLPRPYFEAKPRRAVGFDEVAVFVIPRNADVKLKQELLNRGYAIAEYDPDVEGDRQKVVNQFEEYKFSLSDVGETQKSTGRYNVYGQDIALPSAMEDIAPVPETISKPETVGETAETAQNVPILEDAPMAGVENSTATDELFQDDNYSAEQEIDRLAQQVVDLEGRLFEMAEAEQFGEEFNRLSAEWSALNDKLKALEQETNSTDADRLSSLEDTDAPPDIGPVYNEQTETTPITKKLENDIARVVRSGLALGNKDMADVHRIIQGYVNGEISGRDQLFNELKKYNSYTETQYNEDVAEAKKWLRDQPVRVDDSIKWGVADYNILQRQNFGKIRFSKNGAGVDVVYHELSEMWPGLFPESIYVPGDQFEQIVKVANMDSETVSENEIPDEAIMDVADTIIRSVSEYRQTQQEKDANRHGRESFNSLMQEADKHIPQFSPEAYRRLSERPNVVDPDDVAPMPETYTSKSGGAKGQLTMFPEEAKAESNRVAEILPSRKHEKPNGISNWQWTKEHVFSHGAVFETLSLKTGNRELQARFDAIRRAEGIAQNFIVNGDPKKNVAGLKGIMQVVDRAGTREAFNEYLAHQLNVDRMTLEDRYGNKQNAPVFGEAVTADVSRLKIAEMDKAHPDFKRKAKLIYGITDHLRGKLVEAGFISQETADRMHEMYPHYVPIVREGFDGQGAKSPYAGVISPIKSVEGGSNNIEDLFDTLGSRIVQTYKAIAKNRFGAELKNTLGTTIESEAEVAVRNEVANRIAEAEKYGAELTAKERALIEAQVAADLKNGYLDADSSMDDVLENVDQHEKLLQEGQNGKLPTYTVFENGKRVKFEISEEMYEAMKPRQFNRTVKPLNKIGDARRAILTTYSPTFMLTNPIKDIGDIVVNSQHPMRTYFSIPAAIKEIVTKGKYYRERMAHGGDQDSYFDTSTMQFKKERGKIAKTFGIPLEGIRIANEAIEQIPRLAEYIASRKMGRSIDVSMLDSARVTTNFGAPGDLTSMLNRNGFTFLGASVEGFNQQVRNVREAKAEGAKGWLKLAAKYTLAGLPAILLNSCIWGDDDEYEELSDYVKENYYIVHKYGDGKFVRIPKGRAVAVIQNGLEQMYNAVTGNDEVDLGRFAELFFSNLAPNDPLENNVLSPIRNVWENETWYGDDLVPQRLQDLPASEQYDESTDLLSRWIGDVADSFGFDISPVKVNYLLDQYTGGIGDMILPYLTPEADGGGLGAAFRDKFTTDSTMKNQNISDFYDTMDKLTTNAKSSKATDEDALSYQYMNSINSELSKLYQQKREIQNSGMSDSQKAEEIREIQNQIVSLTKNGLATYDEISYEDDYREGGRYARIGDRVFKWYEPGEDSTAEPGWRILSGEQQAKYETTKAAGDKNYATDGTNHYYWYEPGKGANGNPGWKKMDSDQLKRQNKVTSGLRIPPETYWSKKEEYDFAYDYPERYAVSKAVGGYDSYRKYNEELYDIKADKDSNGKSISGSRKEKVIDYINGLDADYGEKIILLKSEYPADDTYNYEIIDYLNSRDDISYTEMVTILKELGFTVNGNSVTWD